MVHQYRFVVVVALLGAAAALATEKGRLPLALRGLRKALPRAAGAAETAPRPGVSVWRRLAALGLCLAAFAVAAAG